MNHSILCKNCNSTTGDHDRRKRQGIGSIPSSRYFKVNKYLSLKLEETEYHMYDTFYVSKLFYEYLQKRRIDQSNTLQYIDTPLNCLKNVIQL